MGIKRLTREQWSRLWMWLTIIPAAFFAWVLGYGIYLGLSGKQEFTFENAPPEAEQAPQQGLFVTPLSQKYP